MILSFHGAARCVTGSKHLLQLQQGTRILLDCGMFQGMGKQTFELNSDWGFDPASLDHVIISHAHIDHTGLLPKLIKDGFQGTIYCTAPTADLMRLMLPDSAHIQELDTNFAAKRKKRHKHEIRRPLYSSEDARAVDAQVKTVPFRQPFKIGDDVECTFYDCGHIIGSASVYLKIKDGNDWKTLLFSGDIGRQQDMMLPLPAQTPQADYVILESTYGNRLHDLMSVAGNHLLDHIRQTCLERGGKLILPSFSVGRTQEILFMLNRMELQDRLPALDYFVDSPLSVRTTMAVKQHVECFNADVQHDLQHDKDIFSFSRLKMITELGDSTALNERKEPCVIISASGMAEAGRVKHHIMHAIEDASNTILFTGYCEPSSLGGRLLQHPQYISIYSRDFKVNAGIASLKSLSAHGDYEDLCAWLHTQKPEAVQRLFLVHGEYDVQQSFRARLNQRGYGQVEIPVMHQHYEL